MRLDCTNYGGAKRKSLAFVGGSSSNSLNLFPAPRKFFPTFQNFNTIFVYNMKGANE